MSATSAMLATVSLVVTSGADCRCEGIPFDKSTGRVGVRSDLGIAECDRGFRVN